MEILNYGDTGSLAPIIVGGGRFEFLDSVL